MGASLRRVRTGRGGVAAGNPPHRPKGNRTGSCTLIAVQTVDTRWRDARRGFVLPAPGADRLLAMPRIMVFVVFAVAHFLSNFVRMANAVIADDLTLEFGMGPAELGWMTSLFFLAFAAAQLPFGWALDRFGARVVTPSLMLVAVAGALVFAAGQSIGALTVGRALMGLGTAGILMGGLKALSTWFDARRFALISGALVALGSSGGLMAATPLAWLSTTFGWRIVFVFGAGALAVAAALLLAFGRAGPSHAADTSDANDSGGFGVIFRTPAFWRMAGMAVATTGVVFAFQSLWAGPYLTQGVGLATLPTGNVLLAFGIGASLGYLLLGAMGERIGVARMILFAALAFIAVEIVLAFTPLPGGGRLAASFLMLGAAGSASGLVYSLARSTFPLALTGRAVTAINLFLFAGGFALQWGLGVWLDAGLGGFGSLFALTATLGVAAVLVFLPDALGASRRLLNRPA